MYREDHVSHILFDSLLIGNDIKRFVHTLALPRQDGLVHSEGT